MIMAFSISNKCIGCGKCRSRCASGAIKLCEDSGRKYCRIDPELCVSCGHCAHFCESGAILDADGHIARAKHARPRIDTVKCTGCMLCIESCPEFALALTKYCDGGTRGGHVFLARPNDCLGCGHCAKSCQVRAIEMLY